MQICNEVKNIYNKNATDYQGHRSLMLKLSELNNLFSVIAMDIGGHLRPGIKTALKPALMYLQSQKINESKVPQSTKDKKLNT